MTSLAQPVQWSGPANVSAWFTFRIGGVSAGGFESLNLASHVGDADASVANNRARLAAAVGLPSDPVWLDQVHGCDIVEADGVSSRDGPQRGDGAVASEAGIVCVILTADCLPVLLTNRCGTRIGAVHAGWRGLAAGVLDNAVAAMASPGRDIIAWLGPAISAEHYEVGEDVYRAFVSTDAGAAAAFQPNSRGRWQADLYALAKRRLAAHGVHDVHGGQHCTFRERERFFSHRRSAPCGRMAALIWRA